MMFLKNFFLNLIILTIFGIAGSWGQRGQWGPPSHRMQQGFIRGFEQNFCRTPLDEMGSCVSLKFCPEVLTLFQRLPQNSAKQYSMNLQRICGNRITSDQYPVVCCTVVKKDDATTTSTTTPTPISTSTSTSTTTSTEAPDQKKTLETPATSCFTQDFTTGSCKPLQDCPILYDELKKDPSNEQLKSDLRTLHTSCGNQGTTVCCPTETPARPTKRDWSSNQNTIHDLPTEEEGCGSVNITLPKVVGGEESQLGAWPWMALIGYDPYSTRPFRCGGTLITARHVLTAAHCIRSDLSFVRLGEFDLSTETETNHVDVNVIKHAKHHQYGKDRRSDVAVLLLERSVQFTELIAPICMPHSIQLRSRSYIDSMPFVAGWGHTSQGGSPSQVLKQAQLPIQPNEVCRQTYTSRVSNLSQEDFNDSVFCVGFTIGGADTCQGDSGGPLMIPELYKGVARYYLIGVVSYGIGCAKVPGIYINVQKKMDWIEQQVREL